MLNFVVTFLTLFFGYLAENTYIGQNRRNEKDAKNRM